MAFGGLFKRKQRPLGERGEARAARFLKRAGYTIIDRNVEVGRDEADIIAIAPDDRTLVIVEVKTRSSDQPPPEARLDRKKQYHLARLASRLLKSREYADRSIRFDAISIVWPEGGKPSIRHFEAAFESPF